MDVLLQDCATPVKKRVVSLKFRPTIHSPSEGTPVGVSTFEGKRQAGVGVRITSMKCSQGLLIATACLLVGSGCSSTDPPEDSQTQGGADGIESGVDSFEPQTTGDTTTGGESSSTTDGTTAGAPTSETGSSEETGFVPPVCGVAEFVLEAAPPNVVLVLDKSGSMVMETWDADQDEETEPVTRWSSLHNVVSFILDRFDGEVNFGAVLFPSKEAEATFSPQGCVVEEEPEVGVAPRNGEAILDMMPSAGAGSRSISGGTPAAEGIRAAREHLLTLDDTVERFMILVTDGAANCSTDYPECDEQGCDLFEVYDENLPAIVGTAFEEDGIPTFVVGIDILDALIGEGAADGKPAVNTFEKLNEVADAGGRARDGDEKFFNALNEADLQAALEQIAGQVFSCTIPLDPPPEHANFVKIAIDGDEIPRVEDCDSDDGWVFVGEDTFDTIRLCNAACEMLGVDGKLDAKYECPPPG